MIIDTHAPIKRYGKQLGEYALFFRSIANQIDQNPDKIFEYLDEASVRSLYQLKSLDSVHYFYLYEALSYGDIGVFFACPRTCLSGLLLLLSEDKEHQNYYFERMSSKPMRTFFALTERNYGSNASSIETRFTRFVDNQNISISGHKLLVGNVGVAEMGIIIGRTSAGPLSMCAALITSEDFAENKAAVSRNTLPMYGIKPAMLGEAIFENFIIPRNRFIGMHLNAGERGLQLIVKTFNIMRLAIAGLALGHAQAIIDYVTSSRYSFRYHEKQLLQQWQARLNTIRVCALDAASKNISNRLETSKISLVKVQATKLVEEVAIESLNFYGSELVYEHPYLMKAHRDCFGYEYMDGTTSIQRKNVYQGFVNDKA